jgi:hypothetical protein
MTRPHVHGTHTRGGGNDLQPSENLPKVTVPTRAREGPFSSCQGADRDRTHSFETINRNKNSICLYRKPL